MKSKSPSKSKLKPKLPSKKRVTCFSCNKRRIKYIDGLCETCHQVALATTAQSKAEEEARIYVIPKDVESFGDALRWLRTQRRMTIRMLAEAIEVTATTLSDVEHNRRDLSDEEIVRAAGALHTSAFELKLRSGKLKVELAAWLKNSPDFVEFLKKARPYPGPTGYPRGGFLGGCHCGCGCPHCGRMY
jgi:transcriptional regulator with XRE-family HTH domain